MELSFHNYLTTTSIPHGIANLLGLGLKFCLTPHTKLNQVNAWLQQFNNNTQKHFIFNQEELIHPTLQEYNNRIELHKTQYIPKLYIQSTWTLPQASNTSKQNLITSINNLTSWIIFADQNTTI